MLVLAGGEAGCRMLSSHLMHAQSVGYLLWDNHFGSPSCQWWMVQGLPQGCPGDDRREWISCFISLCWNGEGFGNCCGRTVGKCSAAPSARASMVVASPVPSARLVTSLSG